MPNINPILAKALEIIADKGWGSFELKDLADESISLSEVHQNFASKTILMEAFSNFIDQQTLEHLEHFNASETQKDKLFSIIMTRLDVLSPYKTVIKSMWRETWMEPLTILHAIPMGLNSMTWLLQAAGVSTTGIGGALRTKAFAVCYLNTIRSWIADDSAEMDQTMVALDTNLLRLEQIPQFFQTA